MERDGETCILMCDFTAKVAASERVCLIQSAIHLLATTEMCGNQAMCCEKGSGRFFTAFRSCIRGVTSSLCTCEHKRASRAKASQM